MKEQELLAKIADLEAQVDRYLTEIAVWHTKYHALLDIIYPESNTVYPEFKEKSNSDGWGGPVGGE